MKVSYIRIISIFVFCTHFFVVQAVENSLLRIGSFEFNADDFEYIYRKNNLGKTLDESLSLYINYKLKIIEAITEGIDTLPSFIAEMKTYRDQLVRKYMTDTIVNMQLLLEAYERSGSEINAGHILIAVSESDTLSAYQHIMNLRDRSLAGEDFEQLATQYSDDPSAKINSGKLGYFSVFHMVYPFESAAYTTDIGHISMPVRTKFGYHIIKVYDRKTVNLQPFDKMRIELQQKITRSDRVIPSLMTIIEQLKKEYHFIENEVSPIIDSTPLNTVLFTIEKQPYTIADFKTFLKATGQPPTGIREVYNNYVIQTLLNYTENRLEDKDPDFGFVVNEYKDGLLLFEISEREVWSKTFDSETLSNFYREHTKNYRWPKRMDATVYFCADNQVADRLNKVVKNKNAGLGRLPNGLYSFFCDRNGVNPCVDTLRNIFPKNTQTIASKVKWKKGCSQILEWNGKFVFLDIHSILRPARKTFEEAYGEVLADYQDSIEQQWIEKLKKKYPVTVDQTVWAELKRKYE